MNNPSHPGHKVVFLLIALALTFALWQPRTLFAAPDPEPVPSPTNCLEANVYYGSVPPGGSNAEVLVFVHGFTGLAIDWWYVNFGSGFNDMYDLAYAAGYRTAFINTNARLNVPDCRAKRKPTQSVLDAGAIVAAELELIADHYDVDQVSVIAHSKGGLDTQMAMAFNGASTRVKNLITLSSPHRGEKLADLIWGIPAIRELLAEFFSLDDGFISVRVTNMKAVRLYVDNLDIHDGTSYFSAGGTGWEGSGGVTEIAGAILQLLEGDNDGIVSVASTDLPYKLPFFVADYDHNQMYQGDEVWPYIHEVLTASPTSVVVNGPTTVGTAGSYTFSATVSPLSLTMPLTTTWSADGFATQIFTGTRASEQVYRWNTPGVRYITVTMANAHGAATTVYPVQIVAPTPFTPPSSVTLAGPSRVLPGETATFTATVDPVDVTQDVQYTWHVTGQSTVVHTGGPTDSLSIVWSSVGSKSVQVTALVSGGAQSDTMSTQVGRPPQGVTLSGPQHGATDAALSFTATVSNGNVTFPVTFEWRTADNDTILRTVNTVTDIASFSYPEAAVLPLAVRASNGWGDAVAFTTIDIKVPPTALTLTGDLIGTINTTQFFSADVGPSNTSVPLTYTWTTTGTPALLVQSSGLTDMAGFSWPTPGQASVDLSVTNGAGVVSGSSNITIQPDTPSTAPVSLSLEGLNRGLTDQSYAFVASVEPITATQPITYTWQADGQPDVVRTSGGNDVLSYAWSSGGQYVITATATNAYGTVTNTHQIAIIKPIASLSQDWPSTVAINEPFAFEVSAWPITATTPVTYTWWTLGLPNPGIIQVGGLTNTFTYTWTTEGPTALSVKVFNGDRELAVDREINIVHPVTDISLAGPSSGGVGLAYEFTADVLPITATQPLDYQWQATDQDLVLHSGGISDAVSFAWSSPGIKTIVVTATNGLTPYSATLYFDVAGYPPTGLAITGPTQGYSGSTYTFTATASPPLVTTPLTYTWEATGLAPIVQMGGVSNQRDLSWPTTGQKTITVTAANRFAAATQTYLIDIQDPLIAPQNLSLAGPTEGVVSATQAFTATVSPGNATLPITYTWQATDQPLLIRVAGSEDLVQYTWSSGGSKSVTVTATNAVGEVSDVSTIMISVPLSAVVLAGPSSGPIDASQTFTATVSPANVTLPVTYTWVADGQAPVVHVAGTADVVSFSWPTPGERLVTVTVDNGSGQASDNLTFTAFVEPTITPPLFLPMFMTSGAQAQAPVPPSLGWAAGKVSAPQAILAGSRKPRLTGQ